MISTLFLTFLLAAKAIASDPAAPAYSVISRSLPSHLSQLFNFTLVNDNETEEDASWFTHSSNGDKVAVAGSSPVALTAGAYDWLKLNADISISWDATGGDSFPPDATFVPPETAASTKKSPYKFVYYNNVCTYGYSGLWWWSWDRWEKELDRMALNGVTSPLLALGQEYIWNQVWTEFNLTQGEIDEWNAGPAYQAWFYMGNLKSFGGPVTLSYMERTRELQAKILERARWLGMTPILPSFSGFVPEAFSSSNPGVDVKHTDGGWGGDFSPVAYVEPTSSTFADISQSFITKYCAEFSCNTDKPNYYAADLYNELSPPSSDPTYLSSASSAVFAAMQAADKNAIWVTQGWMFFSDESFWQTEQISAFLGGPPMDKLIVIDLFAEEHPIWKDTSSFSGTPFIFSTIFNFGGRSGIFGSLPDLTSGITTSLTADNTMVGLGAAPEAIETNPIDYDLLWDHVYNTDLHDIPSFTEKYSDRRYKTASPSATSSLRSAWSLLSTSALASTVLTQGALGSIFALRPTFNATQVGCCSELPLYYDPQDMIDALGYLLEAGEQDGQLEEQSTYRFDVINAAVQVLSNEAYRVYEVINGAPVVEDAVKENMDYFLHLLDTADAILMDQPERMLGFWIDNARLAASSDEEEDALEWNARTIVTVWGDRDSTLNEYSFRLWSGLLSTFYRERWTTFFGDLIEDGEAFDQDTFIEKIKDFEMAWTTLTVKDIKLPNAPNGGGMDIAKKVYEMFN